MSTIKEYINNQILNSTNSSSSGLYKRIDKKISDFKKMLDNGAVSLPGQTGIDKLVADRVLALYVPAHADNNSTQIKPSLEVKKSKNVFSPTREEAFQFDGFISWGGNDAFICPWLTEFISPDSDGISSNPYEPSQSYDYIEFSRDIKFNSSSRLVSQNRQIVLDFNSICSFNKDSKKLIFGFPNDSASFTDETKASKVINLSTYITEQYWCIGKIKLVKDFLVIQVISFNSESDLNLFERPNCCALTKDEGKCYTANSYLLVVNINSQSVKKLTNNLAIAQNKVDIISGYTDFIIHKEKIFVIKTESTNSVEFKGFMLGTKPKVSGYVKLNKPLKYSLINCKLALYELNPVDTSLKKLCNIDLPTELKNDRFGITGSRAVVTTAKLAANDICPYTFYVQVFYELIAQLPYDYEKDFYGHPFWEAGLGKLLRTDSSKLNDFCYNEDKAENINYLYGTLLVAPAENISYGAVVKIAGHLYAEIPFKLDNDIYENKSLSSLDIIYETVDDARPGYDPRNNNWEVWDYGEGNITAGDIFVIWHLASSYLGSGSKYTEAIVNALGLKLEDTAHPVYVEIAKKKEAKETLTTFAKAITTGGIYSIISERSQSKWSQSLSIGRGAYSFPFERRYAYFGGNRGSFDYPISGYNSSQDTFLVTFTHDDLPLDGNRGPNKARPILILGGLGMHPDPWKLMGTWGEQLSQSPLSVEVWSYDTVNGNNLSEFSHCNSDSQPKVYMQGHEIPLGTIGYYSTTYDASDPANQVFHGMYPLPQNGINIDDNGHKIESNAHIFSDIKIPLDDPFTIYYVLFMYKEEYDTDDKKYKVKNHILESRAYKINPYKDSSYNGFSQMRLDTAKAMAYWWSKYVPAKSTDPVPWFGPSQLDLHISIR